MSIGNVGKRRAQRKKKRKRLLLREIPTRMFDRITCSYYQVQLSNRVSSAQTWDRKGRERRKPRGEKKAKTSEASWADVLD